MQERKCNNNAILIYENKYGSKLICKCKDENSWWKPCMQERILQEDRSSPQRALVFKTPPSKIALQTCNIIIA